MSIAALVLALSSSLNTPAIQEDANAVALIDFGDPGLLTGSAGSVWNDVHLSNISASHALVDTSGAATGWQLDFTPGLTFDSGNTAGVQTPDAGSALEALGWPSTATQDNFYGQNSSPVREFVLSGLDAGSTYDLTILASRLGVGDIRTTEFTASGFTTGSAVLDASNNSSDVAVIAGIVPNGSQSIRVEIRADVTNTNSSGFYYINALSLTENTGAATGTFMAFASNSLRVGRVRGKGPLMIETSVATYGGVTPSVMLDAIDDATTLPPVWLSIPASATAGSAFSMLVDEGSVGIGQYSATLTASAAGYPDAQATVELTVRAANGPLNLLFYGNSYSQANGTLPDFVRLLAQDAGLPAPNIVPKLVGGQTLFFHLTDPDQAAAITTSLALGEEWDFVVMQGFSTEATTALGNPAQFIANAEAIYANVRSHSPNARAVFYQTWARGRGHSVYQGASPTFENPLVMHRQIEASYTQAVDNINSIHGSGSARRAAAGETSALLDFDPSLYDPDLSHPAPVLTAMASAAVFSSIYERSGCSVEPDFSGSSALAGRLSSFGINKIGWSKLAGIADRVAQPRLRRRPGSGDDYILRSGVGDDYNACAVKTVQPGEDLYLQLHSPIGLARGNPSILFAYLGGTNLPRPGTNGFSELYFDPALAPMLMLTNFLGETGHSITWAVPLALSGRTVELQGYVLAPSFQTGNPFTTTDVHELRVGATPRLGFNRSLAGSR